jgi:ATP adenylyltransferase
MAGQRSVRLWAPWRLEYVKAGMSDECIFCTKPGLGNDEDALIVHRGERCFVILNAYPYNSGHLMVAPFEHGGNLEEVDDETLLELMVLTQRSMKALTHAYLPEGFNIGLNQGRIAGAGMADHVHFHVVPRWAGDTNFMPALSDTRVVNQAISESFQALRDAFELQNKEDKEN